MPQLGDIKDLTGRVFGSREVIGNPERRRMGRGWMWYWQCKCLRCGRVDYVCKKTLAPKRVSSCPCDREDHSTPDDIRRMVEMFEAGKAYEEIGEAFGKHRETVRETLKKAGAKTPDRSESKRKYSINVTAFDLDAPGPNYWLGFALADGCVCKGIFSVTLAERDREHLEKLRTFLGCDHPITAAEPAAAAYPGSGRTCRLMVGSKPLCESLARRGIHPRKTWTATVPVGLEADPDFFRGLVDGDGWVSTGKNGYLCTGVTGTREVCESFLAWAKTVHPNNTNVTRNHGIFMVRLGHAASVAVVRAMYGRPGPSLDRKRALAAPHLAMPF